MANNKRSPWAWIPTLYFAEALPYVAVMTISVMMYKRLGISNTDIALYTGWLYLPWVIKPFWSPFVDIIKTKRWWILTMQCVLAIGLAGVAFCIPTSFFFQLTLAFFWIVGFTSATHDIAADGFYMHALDEHDQSLFVGIRSTFYRVATLVGQGLLVIIAGLIETNTGLAPAKLQINADPSYATTKFIALPDFAKTTIDTIGDTRFVYSDAMVNVGTKAPAGLVMYPNTSETSFADYSKMMLDSIKQLNEANGFVAVNEVKTASKKEADKGKLFNWLRQHFGENYSTATNKADNIAIVGVRLNKRPAPDKKIVLVVTNKGGDQSIKLEQDKLSTRFEFTEKNWDKPAYLYFKIDHKLSHQASATFEGASGNIPFAWLVAIGVLSVFFFIITVYHSWALPRPASDCSHENLTASKVFHDFFGTFGSFFTKKQVVVAIIFMLLYRLPEAQLVKLIQPFLVDPLDKGGLGLSTGEVGLVYGTVGIIGLTIGGIIGGIVAARGGLKRWIWPMAWSMSLTCLAFVYLSYFPNQSLLSVNICVFIEQFGYGFGFTAYMLFLIYFSEGEYKTAHYAICTGFMALGMMLPGMMAGWLQEAIGYQHFFVWTMICCAATIAVCGFVKIDPSFGKKIKN
jgi:PAT family beta-lactamase induction signal transducer AmpG